MSIRKICPDCSHGNIHTQAGGCLKPRGDASLSVCGCRSRRRFEEPTVATAATPSEGEVTISSGNVFADMDLLDAEALQQRAGALYGTSAEYLLAMDFDPEKVRNFTLTNIKCAPPSTQYVLGREFDALHLRYDALILRAQKLEKDNVDLMRTVNVVAGGAPRGLLLHGKLTDAYRQGVRVGVSDLEHERELRVAAEQCAENLRSQLAAATATPALEV